MYRPNLFTEGGFRIQSLHFTIEMRLNSFSDQTYRQCIAELGTLNCPARSRSLSAHITRATVFGICCSHYTCPACLRRFRPI